MRGNIINEYLGSSFGQLKEMGEHAYRPFMEDRLQWRTLSKLIAWQLLHAPGSIVQMTLFMKVLRSCWRFCFRQLALLLLNAFYVVANNLLYVLSSDILF